MWIENGPTVNLKPPRCQVYKVTINNPISHQFYNPTFYKTFLLQNPQKLSLKFQKQQNKGTYACILKNLSAIHALNTLSKYESKHFWKKFRNCFITYKRFCPSKINTFPLLKISNFTHFWSLKTVKISLDPLPSVQI